MYTFERFSRTVFLPTVGPSVPNDSAPSLSHSITLPNGGYDGLGDERAYLGPLTISYGCRVFASTPAAVASEMAALRALVGKRDKLYRRDTNGSIRWAYARLQEIRGTRTPKWLAAIDIDLVFEITNPVWRNNRHGDGWLLDDGEYLDDGLVLDESGAFVLDTSPKSLTVVNGGDYPVRNPIITVTAAGSNITALTIAISGRCQLQFTGTITAGTSLVIDCGAGTVSNNGSSAYADLNLGTSHVIEDWLRLDPGNNTVVVTRTGGNASSTINFAYWDGWV